MTTKAQFKRDAFAAIYRAGTLGEAILRDCDESGRASPVQNCTCRDQAHTGGRTRQPAGVCALSEHPRIHAAETGGRHQTAERRGAYAAGRRQTAPSQSTGLGVGLARR